MKLYQIPPANHDLRGESLREQMIARLRQIDGGFYTDKDFARMSDYALLTAFEVTLMGIGHDTADEESKEAFDADMKFGQERLMKKINQTFGTKSEGVK